MSGPAGAGFVAKTLLLVRKDLRIEARGRESLIPMIFFAVAVTLLLAFTLPAPAAGARVRLPVGTVAAADIIAGFLWVTVFFAGLIGFARTFEVEREDDALSSLLLAPLDRSGIFLSKALANLVFVAAIEVLLIPLFAVLFDLDVGRRWPALAGVVVLADVGFVSIGTLFASIAAQTRSRELILPVLSLPALVPVFIAALELTSPLIAGTELEAGAAAGWLGILVGFDLLFAIVGALASDLVLG